jgi:hypothetical protein
LNCEGRGIVLVLLWGLFPSIITAQAPGGANRLTLDDPHVKANAGLVSVTLDVWGKEQVYVIQIARGERVQTALKRLGPLPRQGDQAYHIWVSRPAKDGGPDLVLPVDWSSVGAFGNPATDYPLQQGDRIVVGSRLPEPSGLAQMPAPYERLFSPIEALGSAVWQRLGQLVGSLTFCCPYR